MEQKTEGKTRVLWMDIAKAIGILLVLIVHAGITLGPVTFFGGMFYMPVFFVLAGMTFSCKPEETFGGFLRKKAKRLLLPYFGYNLFLFAFFFVKDSVLTGNVTAASFFPLLGILYSRNSLLPAGASGNVYFMQILNAPTWFLTGLFVTLVIFRVLMQASKGGERKLCLLAGVTLLAAVLLHYLCPILLPWSIDSALYAASFLAFGRVAAQRKLVERVCGKVWLFLLLAAAFVGVSLLNGSMNLSVAQYGRSMVLSLAAGGLGSLLCMAVSMWIERHLRWLGKPMGFLGRHTMPVLCLHLLAYSIVGTALRMLGIGL